MEAGCPSINWGQKQEHEEDRGSWKNNINMVDFAADHAVFALGNATPEIVLPSGNSKQYYRGNQAEK
jgi:hypothetical protein